MSLKKHKKSHQLIIGELLKCARLKKGYSPEEAAKICGLHFNQLQNMENGKLKNVQLFVLLAIISRYGWKLNFYDEGNARFSLFWNCAE